jgi:RimJ/RimL family protein N-acetyltransferase
VTGDVVLRPALARDRDRILAWNGDPEVRARSLDPRPIDVVTHARWMATRLADPLMRLSIALRDGVPVGVVRIERRTAGGPGRISIVIDPGARGCGIGRAAIVAACRADGGPVVAEILDDNLASRACFAAAGFWPAPDDSFTAALGPIPAGATRYLWSPDQ